MCIPILITEALIGLLFTISMCPLRLHFSSLEQSRFSVKSIEIEIYFFNTSNKILKKTIGTNTTEFNSTMCLKQNISISLNLHYSSDKMFYLSFLFVSFYFQMLSKIIMQFQFKLEPIRTYQLSDAEDIAWKMTLF